MNPNTLEYSYQYPALAEYATVVIETRVCSNDTGIRSVDITQCPSLLYFLNSIYPEVQLGWTGTNYSIPTLVCEPGCRAQFAKVQVAASSLALRPRPSNEPAEPRSFLFE